MKEHFQSSESAMKFLFERINYERVQVEAYSTNDFKLDRMRLLLSQIGNPQERIKTIHVAGTKGKGSSCAMLASILSMAGHRTGLFTSPHINRFEERMTVDGVQPSPDQITAIMNRLVEPIAYMDHLSGQMQPTYFELATAISWLYFEEQHVDFAVMEVGLGGRLDSTNVCNPLVTIITNVSRDHTHVLGSTVRQIAWEKAGIIKSGIPILTGATHPDALDIIEKISNDRQATLSVLGRDIQLNSVERRIDPSDADGPSSIINVQT
ncbi:MAG: bifunctional folylpolyglutamate synthase/dihydrofolate synthase, partial [Planctomycetes bacterium]|nr:bifunctional folylpolyglutamate synthase/dihydrofolate synthase [Planctomycetota bacterium]